MNPSLSSNRRSFLKATAAGLSAPAFVRNLISAPPSSTVRLASFGGGGMAYYTLDGIATHPKVSLVCVAELDPTRLGQTMKKYPGVKVYEKWREMLDKEGRNLDVACVGTPDHMHAPMGMSAMRRGLHVYIQKPLAHDIYEVRRLTDMARKKKLVTQMGIQVHSSAEYKSAVQLVQSGAIGKIREVHSWSEKKWGDLDPLPARTDPVPPNFSWDEWLGVMPPRPFLGDEYYHPVNWRKRLDFGTATFGDMGCHIVDPVFGGLQLTAPISVRSEGLAPNQTNWAINAVIHYVFPGTPYTEGKTVQLHWYDGDERPPAEVQALLRGKKMPGQGSIFIGTKGAMLLQHVAKPLLLPEEQFKDYPMPQVQAENHYHQFVEAVLNQGKTSAPFDYAGPLTECVLLGPVATRFPKTTLEWNTARMKFKNSPEATSHVRRAYRSGWGVKGLSST